MNVKSRRALFSLVYCLAVVLLIYIYSYLNNSDLVKEVNNSRMRNKSVPENYMREKEPEHKDLPSGMIGSEDRLSTNNQLEIYEYCESIGVDPYMILSVSLTISNGDMKDLFHIPEAKDKHFIPQISMFLMKSGLVKYSTNVIIIDTNKKIKLEKSYLDAFISLYGKQKLTRLYNNYYLISNKHIE